MKTFEDINFKDHINKGIGFDKQGRIDFDNGYGVSVINGESACCCDATFEVAIMKDGCITYKSGITDDVLSNQTPKQITEIMKNLQSIEVALDHHYFNKKLALIIRDVKMYTPDEMFNELSRLTMVAAKQAGLSVEIKVEFTNKIDKQEE